MALVIVLILIAVVVISIIVMSNNLNKALVKIDEADSGIDVALTKRYDVLTKMIETVKGYAKHEKEVLFDVVKIRKGMTIEEKNEANKQMDETLSKINVLAENYPDLKASENFKTLQDSITDVEEHLQAARRLYNANISDVITKTDVAIPLIQKKKYHRKPSVPLNSFRKEGTK